MFAKFNTEFGICKATRPVNEYRRNTHLLRLE